MRQKIREVKNHIFNEFRYDLKVATNKIPWALRPRAFLLT